MLGSLNPSTLFGSFLFRFFFFFFLQFLPLCVYFFLFFKENVHRIYQQCAQHIKRVNDKELCVCVCVYLRKRKKGKYLWAENKNPDYRGFGFLVHSIFLFIPLIYFFLFRFLLLFLLYLYTYICKPYVQIILRFDKQKRKLASSCQKRKRLKKRKENKK